MEMVHHRKITFKDKSESILRTEDGFLFKLVDKEKKLSTRPLIIFVYDIATLIMAMMNIVLWQAINQNLFDTSPFKNYVVNNIIIFICKFVVCVFSVIGIVYTHKNKPKIFQLYSSVRFTETFLIGSIKLVYTIGLFNYAYQNNIDQTQSSNFKSFVINMAVFNIFDCVVFLSLNIYLCNQLWIGLRKKLVLENLKKNDVDVVELPTELNSI